MKNVLLLAHDDAGQEARLQSALDLTRALEGHLTCLDVVAVPVIGSDVFSSTGEAVIVHQERLRETANRARLEERLLAEGVAWTIDEAAGDLAGCIARASGLSDIIVLNRKLENEGTQDMRAIASAVIVKTRKPILAVPEDARGFDTGGSALVAWDGSLPCMSALTAAVPILKLASSVELFEVQGSSHGHVKEAAVYLSRHGIHAEVSLVAPFRDAPHRTARLINEAAEKGGHAYCVMGAYGHSRFREAVLGGVTREMLSSSGIPLVLAH